MWGLETRQCGWLWVGGCVGSGPEKSRKPADAESSVCQSKANAVGEKNRAVCCFLLLPAARAHIQTWR